VPTTFLKRAIFLPLNIILVWGKITKGFEIPATTLRAALHLEAGPIPLEADLHEISTFFGLEAGLNYIL
jgi:hypothetical protein